MTKINCCPKCGSRNLDTSGTKCLEYDCDQGLGYTIVEIPIILESNSTDMGILVSPFISGY